MLARLGIFLRSLAVTTRLVEAQSPPFWISAGTVLILTGVVVPVFSLWRYHRLIRSLNAGQSDFDQPPPPASAMAAFGLAMAVYPFFVRQTAHFSSV